MIQDAPASGTPLSAAFLARMAREIKQVSYFKIETAGAASKLRELIRLGGDDVEGPWDGEEAITLLPDLDAGATGAMTGGGCIITLPSQRFNAEELFDEVDRLRANSISIVGLAFATPMLEVLDANPGRWDLSCVARIGSSGTVWSHDNKQALLKHLPPGAMLMDSLGSSEAVGLGGFYSEPTGTTVRLSTVVSETLAGSRFSADFALVNRYAGDLETFYPQNDRFGFALSDSSGDLLNIDFSPTSVEDIRQVSVNGTLLTPNGIMASDYNTPLWYSLGITFTANGSDLDYSLTLAGGSVTYQGTLSGKAAATLSGIGVDYDVTGAIAGSNYLVVDNISIPEPSVSLTSLLALGLLVLRRRRA